MFRYLDEQCFRYNNRKDGKRKLTDKERASIWPLLASLANG